MDKNNNNNYQGIKNIYALYDIHSRYIRNIDLFDNNLIAYREYMKYIAQMRQQNPFLKEEDFKVLHLGSLQPTSDTPQIFSHKAIEITLEYIQGILKSNPLEFITAQQVAENRYILREEKKENKENGE